ncbi:MAG: LPS export ABC transporter periplasmic protein LptC [Ignavibacteria bacterium]|nr:LPS export ABC transporter periplasmic protein LptC [Ignavibacteria bacterium]
MRFPGNVSFLFRSANIKFELLAALIAVVLFGMQACSSDKLEPPKTDIVNPDSIPSQESYGTTVTFSDSGKVKAILIAGRIRVYSKFNYTLVDSGAKVDFYKEGIYSSTLTGRRGKIYDATKDVEVYDSVKLVSTDGSVLTTNKLLWINKTQRIKSDEFVHIKTPNEDIQGYGFEADQNLKNYVIYKVSGEMQK